jgi:branched-chain amino acid transport system substrate-binding protein
VSEDTEKETSMTVVFQPKRLAVAVALSGSLITANASTGQNEPIRIGWLTSLTGPLSSLASGENVGVQFAVEQINAAGGINGRKIELITRDTAGDPTKAVNYANQLIYSDKVSFIIGPVNSGESMATVPIVARSGTPNLLLSVADQLTDAKRYPRAFRIMNTNEQWLSVANDYTLNVLKRRKIAIIGDTTGYGTTTVKLATQLLEAKGVKPVYTAVVDPNQTNLDDEMTKARAAGADVIMPWSAAAGLLARILNARGDMGWNVPVSGTPSIMASPVRGLLNKPSYWDNTYSVGYRATTYSEAGILPAPTRKLMDEIAPRTGGRIDGTFWWIGMGYDAVKVIEQAVRSAGSTDPAAVQHALENMKNFQGVVATYTFSPQQRNGFPDVDLAMDRANSFKNGSYVTAPH